MNIAHGLSVNMLHLLYISDAFMIHTCYIHSKLEQKRLYYINAISVRTNFLQQFCHMKTDFCRRYNVGCSEKYPYYENLLHHCCEQVKSSITDVFTNYFI